MLDDETKKYLDMFYEPKFTAYDFIALFCTITAIKGIFSFSKDNLLDFIVNMKKSNQYDEVLGNINLKNNGIFFYSNDLDEAISTLKIAGLLYTISPEKDSSICISDNLDISGIIKSRVQYMTALVNFVNDYQKYEMQKINNAYDKICDQEGRDAEIAVLTLTKKKLH